MAANFKGKLKNTLEKVQIPKWTCTIFKKSFIFMRIRKLKFTFDQLPHCDLRKSYTFSVFCNTSQLV